MRRTIASAIIIFWSLSAFAAGTAGSNGQTAVRHVVDVPFEPVCQLGVGFVPSSSVEGYGDVSMVETEGNWAFAHLWNIFRGDLDLALRLNATFLSDSAGSVLPGQLVRTMLDVGWSLNLGDGACVQARLFPGIYSDLRDLGGSLYMPFSLAMVMSVNPSLSEIVGLEVRPGFSTELMPLIGVVWMIDNRTWLDARLPESRLAYYLGQGWSTYLGFKWQNLSFAMKENEIRAEQITLEDFRLFCGAAYRVSDDVQFSGEIGRVVGRSFEFDDVAGADHELDVSPATFVRFSVGGPF